MSSPISHDTKQADTGDDKQSVTDNITNKLDEKIDDNPTNTHKLVENVIIIQLTFKP
jgi:hypothetical protein